MIIDESLNLTHKQLMALGKETQKEIYAKLFTNSYTCYVESHKNIKFPFEIDGFPCIVSGVILI